MAAGVPDFEMSAWIVARMNAALMAVQGRPLKLGAPISPAAGYRPG